MDTGTGKSYIIMTNRPKDPSLAVTERIRAFLEERGARVSVFADNEDASRLGLAADTDGAASCMIVLGGDGTMLRAAKETAFSRIPLLGVNLGTMGYLAEVEVASLEEALERLLRKDYRVEERMMLSGSVRRGDGSRETAQLDALNDVTVTRCGPMQVVPLRIWVNGQMLSSYGADGIVIATPTGSTGYSLAAGGPILDSEMSALIITPVCPFTLSNRPLVLGANEVITMKVDEGQRTELMLTVDGQQYFELQEGDDIIVEKSRSRALLISSGVRNYTQVLSTKLNWSGGMHA